MCSSVVHPIIRHSTIYIFFFFNDTATTEIYTLSLHDALPILVSDGRRWGVDVLSGATARPQYHRRQSARPARSAFGDRKSTRLNSSHSQISYAVFCLKKKTTIPSLVRRILQDELL